MSPSSKPKSQILPAPPTPPTPPPAAAAAKRTAKPRAKKVEAPRRSILEELPPPPVERDEGDVIEFLKAIDAFKRKSGRGFPSWSEVLDILKSLGYRKPR
jgi:hypothetical protein